MVENGKPRLIQVVGLTEDGSLLVGREARNQYVLYPERTVRSIKRLMGQDRKVSMGPQEYSPQEISALILRRLKQAAEQHLGEAVERAVITVPAYFSDAQRQATRDAGALAGMEKAERLMPGATAENKEDLIDMVERLRDALTAGNTKAMEEASGELADLIYYLES